ncbi:MAG: C25 family cysteine peptidase [Bacteroidia bacterium]|nr:C25 family cysteine peptidase [Bacteroidia bacterium]MDW8235005.1 C25 family cysteine peptidase [Bacteroidia bacterium]
MRWTLGLLVFVWAQRPFPYYNDWIQPGATYIKLQVGRTGIYRATAQQMGLGGVPSASLRLFWRGQEVPLRVEDGGDGVFSGTDFIEFVGHRNDGEPDSVIFRHSLLMRRLSGMHGNPQMSLNHNDTSAYFLTWGGNPGLRYTLYQDPNYTSHPQQNWFWWRLLESYHTAGYWWGPASYEQDNSPLYVAGEGRSAGMNPIHRSVSLSGFRSDAATSFFIEISHAGITPGGFISLEWKVGALTLTTEQVNAPYYFRRVFSVPTSVSVSPLEIRCQATGMGYRGERVHYIAITYPRNAELTTGDTFLMAGVVSEGRYPISLVLRNVPLSTGDSLLVYDPKHRLFWRAYLRGSEWYIPLPAVADSFPLYIVRGVSVLTPRVKNAVIENYSTAQGGEIILITHRSLAASAQAYKQYRENHPTNRRSVFIAFTDAIYDEFGWGRENHPLAIRSLIRWGLDRWAVRPRYVILWGDGVGYFRFPYNAAFPAIHKVPFFGYPATDWGYVTDFYGEGDIIPTLSIGRIPLHTDEQGYTYIEKLRIYESRPSEPWHKWALHLGGGRDIFEQSAIGSHLIACQQVFEGSPYEGRVVYYQKRTGGMQAPPGSPSIKERVDSGVVILQTFGHSGAEMFDVSLYEPIDYDNWGRFPFIIVNGCYQGNFDEINALAHLHGERFLLTPGRGCLWYLSLSGAGFIFPLGNQTKILYEVLFRDSVGLPVGDALVETFRRLFQNGANAFDYYHIGAQTLLGDPSVALAGPRRPDLAITSADVAVSPSEPSAEAGNFRLRVRYHNLGLSIRDSFWLQITHRITATGQRFTYRYRRPPFLCSDSVEVTLPTPAGEWGGINELEIFVDSENEIAPEIREDNNLLRWELFVRSALPLPLYPWPFAVIARDSIALIAATYNQSIVAPQGYYFEIDTSYKFDSPFLQRSGRIQGTTTFGQWALPFRLRDSVVYYWRVRLEGSGSQEWASQSFQYIAGDREGWGQSARPQFLANENRGLSYEEASFRWRFVQQRVRIEARETPTPAGNRRFLQRNGEQISDRLSHTIPAGWWSGAREPGIFIATFHPNTYEPLEYHPMFGNWQYFCPGSCYSGVVMQPEQMVDSLKAVLSRAPVGSPVLLLITAKHDSSSWTHRMAEVLDGIGATRTALRLSSQQKGIIIGQKGAPPGTALETFCPDSSNCELYRDFEVGVPIGRCLSPRIPRPVAWEDAFFAWARQGTQDTITISIYGLRSTGERDTLRRRMPSSEVFNLRPYNTPAYTELQLEGLFADGSTPPATPQLRYWYVLFQPFPDLAVDPDLRWRFLRDTVEEGEMLSLELGVRNLLSATTPDSVEVLYLVQKASGAWDTLGWQWYRPLRGLDTMVMRYTFSSIGLGGSNRLRIIVNPRPRFGERTFVNNRWETTFFVKVDRINPIVDVLFDGGRIQNGDIVSPNPYVVIEVKDENRHLMLDDTNAVVVRVRQAQERGLGTRLSYSQELRFFPARPPDNRARVEWQASFPQSGEYILSVEAMDKSRNRSGSQPYELRFRVVKESSLSYVINYPNPFSTSTRFYYELTGAVLPEVFQIHIYTLSGRLVKVIDLKQLGEVRIGRHLTRYAWDGTDEHGERLGNGVYLYRTVIKMPGAISLQQQAPELSSYFEGGWGKMVLMR